MRITGVLADQAHVDKAIERLPLEVQQLVPYVSIQLCSEFKVSMIPNLLYSPIAEKCCTSNSIKFQMVVLSFFFLLPPSQCSTK